MQTLYYLSTFNPIVDEECEFLLHPHLYFPDVYDDCQRIMVPLVVDCPLSFRKELIKSVLPSYFVSNEADSFQTIKEITTRDDSIVVGNYSELKSILSLNEMIDLKIHFLYEDKIPDELKCNGLIGVKQSFVLPHRVETSLGTYLWAQKPVIELIAKEKQYFIKDIASGIKESRFLHSVSVAETAYEIGKRNDLDPLLCYQAGLFHDMTKDMDADLAQEMMDEHYKRYLPCPTFAYHQFTASYITHNKYHVPKDVSDAILYHCTGKREMTQYQKCLYAADKVEPLRQFDTERCRNACLENLDNGFVEVLKDQVAYFKRHDINYKEYPLSKDMYEYYLEKENENA